MGDEAAIPGSWPSPSAEVMVGAAKGHARFALRSYGDEEETVRLQAAVAAGAAVELLIKAVLFEASPALLAMRGDVHSILVFSGQPGLPSKTYLDCRTITGDEAKKTLLPSPTGAVVPHATTAGDRQRLGRCHDEAWWITGLWPTGHGAMTTTRGSR